MRTLSLFSGIGGLDLGLERAGFEVVGMCEQDEFCRTILAQHWPGVPLYEDVRSLGADVPFPGNVECVAGGFPCQDISSAGKGAGIEGKRSGLWFEMLRVVRLIRPRWVIAENVPALRTRGADVVLGGLEEEGYTCWPLLVGACHAGAPHRRQRVFIVGRLADASGAGLEERWHRPGSASEEEPLPPRKCGDSRWPSRPGEKQQPWEAPRATQPGLGGAAHGLPRRLDARERKARLKALGNAVVPQVAEAVGRAVHFLDGISRSR